MGHLISTRVHGFLDYIVGILLVASPWLFGFNRGGAETIVPVVLGCGALLYSVFTDYELGIVPKIPMGIHLTLDIVSGIFLAASPWLFGFHKQVWEPHVIVGAFEVLAGLMTSRVPAHQHIHAHHHHSHL